MPARHRRSCALPAFTLIELLVVISIIALLIGILLPALGAARDTARQAVCLSNQRQVAVAMNTYVVENKEFFPAAYVYPAQSWDGTGKAKLRWNLADQQGSNPPEGYLHWSYTLFAGGSLGSDAFTCPTMENGGHPATNASDAAILPDGYQQGPGDVDAQVDTLAYTANEFIIPRNKFSVNQPGVGRNNQLVQAVWVTNPSDMIMVTEFIDHYPAVRAGVSKTHRSVNPMNPATGANAANPTSHPFSNFYVWADSSDFGIKPLDSILAASNAGGEWNNPINVVGRHHRGGSGGSQPGSEGSANFVRVDGSGYSSTVRDTVVNKDWGDKFYSVTGNQRIGFAGSGFAD